MYPPRRPNCLYAFVYLRQIYRESKMEIHVWKMPNLNYSAPESMLTCRSLAVARAAKPISTTIPKWNMLKQRNLMNCLWQLIKWYCDKNTHNGLSNDAIYNRNNISATHTSVSWKVSNHWNQTNRLRSIYKRVFFNEIFIFIECEHKAKKNGPFWIANVVQCVQWMR